MMSGVWVGKSKQMGHIITGGGIYTFDPFQKEQLMENTPGPELLVYLTEGKDGILTLLFMQLLLFQFDT